MARRGITTDRAITALGVAVLLLGAVAVWAISQGARFGPVQQPAAERALEQLRAQMGPGAELRYTEAGRGRTLCGYGGLKGQAQAVAFVSRPARILTSEDPLSAEFAELQARFCPGFNTAMALPTRG
jgi:hypothetical protein